MRLEAGVIAKLDVAREISPNGYFLTNGTQDVLLPYNEVEGEISLNQSIDVFLYHDTYDRLTATMKKPLILFEQTKRLVVADIHPKFGCFLEMGIGRHLLLPYSELPELPELRPKTGDEVYVTLHRDKQGRMVAYAAKEADLSKLVFSAPTVWLNKEVSCRIYKTLKVGSFGICGEGDLGFGAFGMVHQTERIRPLRVGELIQARVVHVRPDGRVNLSMRPAKETGRHEHADAILAYLKGRDTGAMPYSDGTPSDVIRDKFGISKAAFKRALGKLLKEEKIVQEEGWTRLVEKE